MDALDFIFAVFITAMIAFLGFCVFDMGRGSENHRQFNNWTQLCRSEGGSVEFWGKTSNGDQYECVKDGKVILHMD